MADEGSQSDSSVTSFSSEEGENVCLNIQSCLPLRLQDICLAALVNQLDDHPLQTLVLLPRHLRYRLLANIPNIDLCRLDQTAVAEGIDAREIWKSKRSTIVLLSTGRTSKNRNNFMSRKDLFMTNHGFLLTGRVNDDVSDVEQEVLAATEHRLPKEQYLLSTTLNILSNMDDYLYCDHPFSKEAGLLVSVPGHTFLQDAIHIPGVMKLKEQCETSDESDYETDSEELSTTFYSYFKLWKTQATPLAKFKIYDDRHDRVITQLVPHRLLPIYKSNDLFQLLETTVIQCGLQPKNLCLSVSMLEEAHMHLVEHYSSQGKINDYKLLLKSLLEKIVILVLTEMSSAIDSLRYIIEAIVGRGTSSALKALEMHPYDGCWQNAGQTLNLVFLHPHLFTDPPCQPNYQGLSILEVGLPVENSSIPHLNGLLVQQCSLQHVSVSLLDSCGDQPDSPVPPTSEEKQLYSTLATLCLREQLRTLRVCFACRQTLKWLNQYSSGCYNLFPFTTVLLNFMQCSCLHNHTLHFAFICSVAPKQLPPLAHTLSVPECGVQHKILNYDITDSKVILPHLLQLPAIQLQELAFSFEKESQAIFHQVAHHPNLQVAKLLIHIDVDPVDVQEKEQPFSTLSEDFEKLFQMPTLKEIRLCGEWIYYSQVRNALSVGLQQQSRVCSLRKIRLETQILKSSYPCRSFEPHFTIYTEAECKNLWGTIFSFPHLQDLEIELSRDFTLCFFNMAHVIFDCFKQFTKMKMKLKSLEMNMHEDEELYNHRWEEVQGFLEIAKDLNVLLEYYRKDPEIIRVTKDLF
jgi:hypothetical protein